MTDSFKKIKTDSDISNAFREGWQAACNLHLRSQDAGFHKAWPASEAFARQSPEDRATDRWVNTVQPEQSPE